MSPKPSRPSGRRRNEDKFIACALASNTKIIVSGDKHLLDVSGYEGVEVLKPGRFVEKYL